MLRRPSLPAGPAWGSTKDLTHRWLNRLMNALTDGLMSRPPNQLWRTPTALHASYLCRNGLHLDAQEQPQRCAEGAPLYNQSWRLRWHLHRTQQMCHRNSNSCNPSWMRS